MGKDLVTLAEYKTYAGINSDNQDSLITAIIPKVSELVKSICRRTFIDYVDDFKTQISKGSNHKILLEEGPLLTLAGVESSADYGNTYTDMTEYTDYVVDLEDSSIISLDASGVFPTAINGYRLTYTAGYETVPEDLKIAVLDTVKYYLNNDAAVHSQRVAGSNTVQIEYITNAAMPAHIRRVLDLYTWDYL